MDELTRRFYEVHAGDLVERWAAARGGVERYFRAAFPRHARILEIGCGSGRDLAILARDGYEPHGIEAVGNLVAAGRRRFPEVSARVHVGEWPDAVPPLDTLGGPFDGILCAAVLHHVPRQDLLRSVIAMREHLKPDGRVLLSVRQRPPVVDAHGRDADGRFDSGVRAGEIQLLLERAGFQSLGRWESEDSLGRAERRWVTLLLQRQGPASGQPLAQIEGVLSRDRKVATYKLALLRALTEVALTQSHRARWQDADEVAIPLQAIAERWILYYWPLFEASRFLPQMQGDHARGEHGLGFARQLQAVIEAFRERGGLTGYAVRWRSGDFAPGDAPLVKTLIARMKQVIRAGPVTHAGGSLDGGRLFGSGRGVVLVSGVLWRELSLMAYWIQDALVVRWAQLVARLSQGEVSAEAVVPALLTQPEPARETQGARAIYQALPSRTCTWSGRRLERAFDVDHIVPYALWRNNDLWNLVPADPRVNARKSDKLPALKLLVERKPAIQDCWGQLRRGLPARFAREVDALSGLDRGIDLDHLFDLVVESVEATAIQRNAQRFALA